MSFWKCIAPLGGRKVWALIDTFTCQAKLENVNAKAHSNYYTTCCDLEVSRAAYSPTTNFFSMHTTSVLCSIKFSIHLAR